MISNFDDLGILKEDKPEDIDKKIQEKLGISLDDMQIALSLYIKSNADNIVKYFFYIAPYGNYEKIIEDKNDKILFLQNEASKKELWKLYSIKDSKDYINNLKFSFENISFIDGSLLDGFVIVDYNGKIQHTFMIGDQ